MISMFDFMKKASLPVMQRTLTKSESTARPVFSTELPKELRRTANLPGQPPTPVKAPHARRTDDAAQKMSLNWPRDHAVTSDCHRASLKLAAQAPNVSGVYILYLNGRVMKVGSAEIGVQKRMQQYYGMNRFCGLPEITQDNRDRISVVWQDCPVCKCNELESKLARKYGLGPWAKRTPHSCDDTWQLLI